MSKSFSSSSLITFPAQNSIMITVLREKYWQAHSLDGFINISSKYETISWRICHKISPCEMESLSLKLQSFNDGAGNHSFHISSNRKLCGFPCRGKMRWLLTCFDVWNFWTGHLSANPRKILTAKSHCTAWLPETCLRRAYHPTPADTFTLGYQISIMCGRKRPLPETIYASLR